MKIASKSLKISQPNGQKAVIQTPKPLLLEIYAFQLLIFILVRDQLILFFKRSSFDTPKQEDSLS
jgi:hypothetical protein